ncbi:MAG TPA: L-rhamnose/proton symporter RhaT, partial [Candidatus Methylomirabilis sp.]|nr:L-rhamnose/proton symporter RhaT [Candidatus Methylomirabilis sp.]
PVLVVLLLGGFTTNFVWCLLLHLKNHTGYQYLSPVSRPGPSREQETIIETTLDAPSEEMVEHAPGGEKNGSDRVPLFWNYVFCALAGTTWYFQFFFYTMGETQMGKFKFSSWTLHMASIMIFSTLWGIAMREWTGTSRHTKRLVALTLLVLIASTVIIGYGNSLASMGTH